MKSSIKFKMEEPDIEFEEKTVQVDFFHTRKIKKAGGSIKFSIPMNIAKELNLTKDSVVYFTIQETGIYMYFDAYPNNINPKYIKSRKLSREGQSGTYYTIIPPMLRTLCTSEIFAVALIHNEGDPSYLWQLHLYTTDSISQNT